MLAREAESPGTRERAGALEVDQLAKPIDGEDIAPTLSAQARLLADRYRVARHVAMSLAPLVSGEVRP